MKHQNKTKDEFMSELVELRQRIVDLETSEAQRKQVEKTLSEANARLQALQQVTAAVHSTLDLENVFRQITDGVVHSMGYTTAFMVVLDDEKNHFEVRALCTKRWLLPQIDKILGFSLKSYSFPADPQLNPAVSSAMKGEVVIAKTLAEIAYPLLSKKVCSALQRLRKTKNYILLPLKVEKKVTGAAFISNSWEEISQEELTILQTFAGAASHAINNANLHMQTKQAKKARQKSEEHRRFLADLLERSSQPLAVGYPDGRIMTCNPAYCKLTGYSEEELRTLTWSENLTPPEWRKINAKVAEEIHRTKQPQRFQKEYIRKDGSRVPIEVFAHPIFDSKGNLQYFYSFFTDITKRKQAEQQLKEARSHFETLFNFMVDPVVIVSGKGKLLEVTDRVQEITGFKKEELVGKSFMKVKILTAKSKAIAIKNLAKRMMGMKIAPYQVEVLTKNGKKIPHEINAAKINYRGKPADMVVFRDISERKKVQEELQGTLKKLRGALGATIQAMTLTVETRDAYTAGHQRRVTNLARAIAKEMKLSKDQIDGIRTAGSIHDMGKIGVPAEILNKPVHLTDNEFNLIKTHPLVGYNILKQIEFPWPVAEIVLQHHERMNGSGYPHGLSGEEILPEARILGIADVVEAMASHRPYRPAVGTDKALEEISQNKGVLYDPQAVDACLKLFREKRFKFE